MIPIRDTHTSSTFPIINYAIIAVNILIFFFQLGHPNPQAFVNEFGFTPDTFSLIHLETYFQVFSSMWLHGGLFHLISNMWFLHIFGDNVEDRLGHVPYLLFYLLAGIFASFSQYIFNPASTIPLIGASGAISGVTGMYFVVFRHARIEALVPSFLGLWHMVKLPAWFFLGYWFVIQVFQGIGSFSTVQFNEPGVAFFAHIGGFIFGYVVASVFYRSNKGK